MIVKVVPNEKQHPAGKLADAELHFTEGVLEGLKLIGFAIWERRSGGGRNVTFIDAIGLDGPAVNFPNDAGADGTLQGFTVRNTLNYPGAHSLGSQFTIL